MQIVIDIDDDLYTRLFDVGVEYIEDMHEACVAIRKGTPLPKGHGRLIDADNVIIEAKNKMKYGINHKYMECVIAHMNLARTIIEADKAESEVENAK